MTEPSHQREQAPADDAMTRTTRWLIGGLAGGALLLVAALASLPFLASQPRPAPSVTFQTIHGERTALDQLRGQVVLVSFWSTTCAPCMAEMPEKIALHRALAARGLATYAVAMSYDRPDFVIDMAQRRQMPFQVALDLDGSVAKNFNNTEITPTKFLIDREGRIVRTYVGSTDFADLRERIEKLLAS